MTSAWCIISSVSYPFQVIFCIFALLGQNDEFYFGPITGRIAQRVARGRFVLDGKVYHMYRNDGNNTIHGTDPCRSMMTCCSS